MNVEPSASNPAVTGAIRQAARMTGADFQYLLATAQVESNLNPNAQVSTSSAKGLYQFIDQTWLATLKEQGPALGYAPYANAISRLPSGQYAVSDSKMLGPVMKLRADPSASALMAGAYTRANQEKLAERLGRTPTEGELYIAHFLGAGGASQLISVADSRPYTPAAAVFPGPARTNPRIFYDRGGHPRSAVDVYRLLVGRYQNARATPASSVTELASIAPAKPQVKAVDPPAASPATFAPDTASLTETYAAAARLSAAPVESGPVFHSLFRTGERQPVAPLVSALWSTTPDTAPPVPAAPADAAATTHVPQAGPDGRGGPLDLFQDQVPDARALFRGRV